VITTHGLHRRRFYIGVSVLMGIIAVAGFWPTYFGPLVNGTIEQPPLIHLHATVFAGWLVLFLAQAVLAATGRLSWHLRLGRIGIGYAVLLVIVGLYTGISRSADRLGAGGDAAGLLFAAVSDMVVFSAFFGAAIAYRRRPQIHKRLMMVAATMLLVAATARMSFLPAPPLGLPVRLAVWFSPIALAMAHDFRSRRLVHPVYVIGLGAFLVRIFSRGFIVETDAWAALTRWAATLVA
jgi:hypothetical protein